MVDVAPNAMTSRCVTRLIAAHWRTFFAYFTTFIVSIAGPIWVHRLRPSDLSYPWRVRDSDLSSVYSLTQALGQSWTGLVHHSLGAPYKADLALAFIPDDLHLGMLRILVHITGNPFTAVNLFYVLTFGLCGVSFLYLCDRFSCNRFISTGLAVAYAWLPYHFTRMNDGHVFLAAYYMIPVGVLTLLRLIRWLMDDSEPFLPTRKRSLLFGTVAVMAVGSSGAYYGLFFALLSTSAVLLVPRIGMSLKVLFKRLIVVALTTFGFIAAPIARNIWARTHGLESQLMRSPIESIQFGGSISRLYVPWGVWIPERLRPMVEVQEFEWLAVPILAVVGIWLLTLGLARGILKKDPSGISSGISELQFLFFWSTLFYASGGLSLVFAYAINPSFRTWNRMAIVIMTLAILVVAIFASRVASQRFSRYVAFFSIVFLAVITQLLPLNRWGIAGEPDPISQNAYRELERVASAIENRVPKGCEILQLPIMEFPEGGIVDGVGNGHHLWLPLITRGYRWSYGASKDSVAGQFWPKQTDAIEVARSNGFCAAVASGPNSRQELRKFASSRVFEVGSYTLYLFE